MHEECHLGIKRSIGSSEVISGFRHSIKLQSISRKTISAPNYREDLRSYE